MISDTKQTRRRPGASYVTPKRKYRKAVLPIAGALIICLLAWAGLSRLITPRVPENDRVSNSISKPLPHDQTGSPPGPTEVGPTGQAQTLSSLVVSSPLARAALQASPLASGLTGIGSRLIQGTPPVSSPEKRTAAPPPARPQAAVSDQPPEKPPAPKPAGPKPAASAPGLQFTVHLASFGVKENADQAAARLKAAGYPAFLQKTEINNKIFHRLMVGRFSSQAEAEAYGQKLARKNIVPGLGPFTVKPIVSGPEGRSDPKRTRRTNRSNL